MSQNKRMTFELLDKEDLGYVVISKPGAYDGLVFIKMGKERGYPGK